MMKWLPGDSVMWEMFTHDCKWLPKVKPHNAAGESAKDYIMISNPCLVISVEDWDPYPDVTNPIYRVTLMDKHGLLFMCPLNERGWHKHLRMGIVEYTSAGLRRPLSVSDSWPFVAQG